MGFLHLPALGKVHFHEYGTGTKPMLAFHGYGMTGKQFHVLAISVLPHYHIYGFDHFFHGDSRLDGWTEKQILAGMPKAMLRNYVEEWFKIYGRQRFSIMAYSIGANLALILVEEYPDLIDDIILMAPDGITGFKGFEFITNKPVGRYIFKRVIKSKWLAPALLKMLKRLSVIDEALHRIAYNEINTQQKRLDVYYTLNMLRLLKPDVNKVATLINQYAININLVFGRDDKLFPKSSAMPFINLLANAKADEVPLGHWLVTPALDEYLTNNKV
jgi:pimeloyl-ACP methyl ester carboxylesterase